MAGIFLYILLLLVSTAKGNVLDEVNAKTDEYKEKIHVVDSLDLLIYLLLLTVAIITTWVFKKHRLKFIHESGVSVILGLVVGAILRFTGSTNSITVLDVAPKPSFSAGNGSYIFSPPDILRMNISGQVFIYSMSGPQADVEASQEITEIQEKATFDAEIFFYMILPPIIFNAGYSMRKKHFFSNIGSILTFALLGTVISTFAVAGLMWMVVQLISTKMRFLDTLYFGAIISATDPVTTLAIFTDLHVDPTLTGLVLGESLLNDAVAIVLCGAVEDYSRFFIQGDPDSFEVVAFFQTILNFFTIFFGSVGLGSLLGAITALITKFTHVRDYTILETSMFFLLSYSSYLFAEVCSMSGIVSVLFCGITQAHYTFHNLSAESKLRTRQLFELLNFLMENFIFSYIGVSMFTFSRHKFEFIFILGAVLAIGVARALNIYPLSLLLNLGRSKPIPCKYQHMMWFSGLRGALAFALAIKNTVSEARQIILTTTSLIAIVTVIFCGGLTPPLLGLLKIPIGVVDPGSDETQIEAGREEEEGEGHERRTQGQGELVGGEGGCSDSSIESQSFSQEVPKSSLARHWKSLDKTLLKPLLTNSQPTLQETMAWLGPVARWLTTTDQMAGTYITRGNLPGGNESYREQTDVSNPQYQTSNPTHPPILPP
ncbi:sodium/hydrogen exchanger 9 isoform X2 [Eurytemora carolleeae]|nr:sodium/hydrogen exchanger 9 isoform X2 [Eurytemora carolleeae]|eukprot:XP_023324392.1 sodium/hydrogen exchanger 9-like isoform X2 [Eurytemora affinis]